MIAETSWPDAAMTPFRIGHTGRIFAGVRPSMSRASFPNASMSPRPTIFATSDGSLRATAPRV